MPQDEPRLPVFDVIGPSPVYDLTSEGLWARIRKIANLVIPDVNLEKQLSQSIDALVKKIAISIGDYTAGYLIRVNIFVDGGGGIVIPGGELITPIGLGREPVDALAEFNREDKNAFSPNQVYRDASFFFWITK